MYGVDTKCEKCNTNFVVTNDGLKMRSKAGGIQELYFECPACKEVYPIIKTNAVIRKLQAQQHKLEDKMSKGSATLKQTIEWTTKQRRIKELLDALNGKVKVNGE